MKIRVTTQESRSKSKHFLVLGLFLAAIIIYEILNDDKVIKPALHQIIVIPTSTESGYDLATLMYMSGSVITAFFSFIVAKKYIGSEMFTKAYLFLGLGFSCWFIGDVFFFYDVNVHELPTLMLPKTLGAEETFPLKPADFMYLGIYPNMALHLYLNTNWFSKNKLKITKKDNLTKFFLFGVPTIGAIVYFHQYGSINYGSFGVVNFESGFGALSAIGASVTLGLVFWGARVFRQSALSPAWTLLLLGIFCSTVGDYLYYQVENYNENYSLYSFSTLFYLLTFMIMNYGLYKHRKIV